MDSHCKTEEWGKSIDNSGTSEVCARYNVPRAVYHCDRHRYLPQLTLNRAPACRTTVSYGKTSSHPTSLSGSSCPPSPSGPDWIEPQMSQTLNQ